MRIPALLIIFLFLFSGNAFAMSLRVDAIPDKADDTDEIEVGVTFSCQSCKDSYLRAVFFAEGTTHYFGYTQNEMGGWINATADKTLFYHLSSDSVSEGSWSGKLKAKVDRESSYYKGSGTYSIKVGRYTSADSSATWSENAKSIVIKEQEPQQTATTPTPSPSAPPSTTPTAPPTPTKNSTTSSTPTPTRKIISPVTPTKEASAPAEIKVLGSSDSALPIASVSAAAVPSDPPDNAPVIEFDNLTFIGVGAFTLTLLFVIFRRLRSLPIS